jgi:hypothetical protein
VNWQCSDGIGQNNSEVKVELVAAVKARALADGPVDDDRLTPPCARMARVLGGFVLLVGLLCVR